MSHEHQQIHVMDLHSDALSEHRYCYLQVSQLYHWDDVHQMRMQILRDDLQVTESPGDELISEDSLSVQGHIQQVLSHISRWTENHQ